MERRRHLLPAHLPPLPARRRVQEDQRELAKTIRVSGSILLSTVSNFLDFFKMEAGKQLDIVRSPLDLRDLVADVHCIIEAMVGREVRRRGGRGSCAHHSAEVASRELAEADVLAVADRRGPHLPPTNPTQLRCSAAWRCWILTWRVPPQRCWATPPASAASCSTCTQTRVGAALRCVVCRRGEGANSTGRRPSSLQFRACVQGACAPSAANPSHTLAPRSCRSQVHQARQHRPARARGGAVLPP